MEGNQRGPKGKGSEWPHDLNHASIHDWEGDTDTHRLGNWGTGGFRGGSTGFVLRPTLWNVLFDGMLCLDFPSTVEIVAYADDLAVLVLALIIPDLETAIARTINLIRAWMEVRGLSLAPHRSEVIIFLGRRVADLPSLLCSSRSPLVDSCMWYRSRRHGLANKHATGMPWSVPGGSAQSESLGAIGRSRERRL